MVIGILAAITIVSYTGVTQKANIAAIQSDLDNASKKLKLYYTLYGSYPTALDASNCPTTPNTDTNYCLKFSGNSSIAAYASGGNSFSLNTTNGSIYYKITDSSPAAVNPGGIVPNGDFEYAPTFVGVQTTDNWMDGTVGGSTTRQPYAIHAENINGGNSARFDPSNAHTGSYSLKIHATNGVWSQCRVNANGYWAADGIKVLPNTSYKYSIWMKSENVSGVSGYQNVQFLFSDSSGINATVTYASPAGNGSAPEFDTTGSIATNKVWTQYTGSFTTGASVAWFHPEYRVNASGTYTGDFYFDDISVSQ